MNPLTGNITRLFDFTGRQNRQPFWLWVLIVYGFQTIASVFVMIPLGLSYYNAMQPLMRKDQDYLNAHPELVQKVLMDAMLPMMRGMMGFVAIIGILFVLLLVAATVRRLHDTDRSGWWAAPVFVLQIVLPLGYAVIFPRFIEVAGTVRPNMPPAEAEALMAPLMQSVGVLWLVGMLSFIMMIVLIVFLCGAGTRGPNRYGQDPLAPPDFQRFPG